MITCVSSVFDWDHHSIKWKNNMILAQWSWAALSFKTIYVAKRIEGMPVHGHVEWTGDEDFPPVYRLLEVASQQHGKVILLDADLRIKHTIYNPINELKDASIITSRRWSFQNGKAWVDPDDFAVDFFMGHASLFVEPAKLMPKGCRVGHNLWDSWLVGYFNKTLGDKIVSATKYGFLYHPKHDERNCPYGDDHFKGDEYSAYAGHPAEA